jgi:hypothetical protein
MSDEFDHYIKLTKPGEATLYLNKLTKDEMSSLLMMMSVIDASRLASNTEVMDDTFLTLSKTHIDLISNIQLTKMSK